VSDVATLTRLVAELSGRLDALAARVPVRIGTPQVPSPNLVVEVIQSAHGFTLGQVVTNTGVSWDLAAEGDDSIGVVCKVVDEDTVWICEWGIVCIDSATFAEGSVYYLGATAGTPTTTPGTPKRAVFFAVSPTMILVTNPAKDASGGGLDPITGPAVLGKADAGSGDPAAITGTADTVLVCTATGLEFAQATTAMVEDLAITADKIAAGAVGPDELADTTVTPAAYGSATQVATVTVDQQGRITDAASVTVTPAWTSITSTPATFPPSDHTHTLAGDVSGTTAAAVVDKLKGKDLASAVGAVTDASEPDLFLWWDKANSAWSTFEWFQGTPLTGWLNCYDSAAGDGNAKMASVMAGTKNSVFGRASNTDGLPDSIPASTDGQTVRMKAGVVGFGALDLSVAEAVENALPIVNGGTGAITLTAALKNLSLGFDTETDFTASGTYTATKTGFICVVVQGAGGGGNTTTDQTTLGYIANVSGGATTTQLSRSTCGGGGGAGSLIIAFIFVTSGETFAVTVGAGGAVWAGGGASSFINNSVAPVSLSAGGGQAGADNYGNYFGKGGAANVSIANSRQGYGIPVEGMPGCPARTIILSSGPCSADGGQGGSAVGVMLSQSGKGNGGKGSYTNGAGAAAGQAGYVIVLSS